MATLVKKPARAVGTLSGNQPQVRAFMPDTAVELYGGDFVKLASGLILRCDTPIDGTDLAGLLLHDTKQGTSWHLGSGAANTKGGGTYGGTFMGSLHVLGSIEGLAGHVVVANADTYFEAGCEDALALADIGDAVEIQRDTSGSDANVWEVDQNGGTTTAIVIAIPNLVGQAIGDTNARVWFIFDVTACALTA